MSLEKKKPLYLALFPNKDIIAFKLSKAQLAAVSLGSRDFDDFSITVNHEKGSFRATWKGRSTYGYSKQLDALVELLHLLNEPAMMGETR